MCATKDMRLCLREPRKLRRPVARVDPTAGARMHGRGVQATHEPVRRLGGTGVAARKDLRPRPSPRAQRKQAVAEARRRGRNYGGRTTRLVDRLAARLDEAV